MTVKLGPKKKGNELFRQEEQETELALSASTRTMRVYCGPWRMRRMERLATVKAVPCGGQQDCWKQGGCVWTDIPWVWEQSLYCFIPCPIWKPNKWKNNGSNDSMPSWWGHYDGRRFTQRQLLIQSRCWCRRRNPPHITCHTKAREGRSMGKSLQAIIKFWKSWRQVWLACKCFQKK